MIRPKSKVLSPKPRRSAAADWTRNLARFDASTRWRLNASAFQRFNLLTYQRINAFTLIELMIVVGIMGIVLTMGVPIVYRVFHRPAMAQALVDVVEVCSNARGRAILQGREVDLVFHPREGRFEVAGAARSTAPSAAPDALPDAAPVSAPAQGSGLSATLDLSKLRIEMLDVNLTEYKDEDLARVRFYPNGTCDEMTLILHSDDGQWKKISLEITTGLASVGEVR